MKTQTPRTDAYVEYWIKDRTALWSDFARQLEIELRKLEADYSANGRFIKRIDPKNAGDIDISSAGQ